MFSFLRSNIYFALAFVVLVATALLVGYQRGHASAELACADARAEAERQVAQSIAELAHQRAASDAEAEKRRAEAGRLSRQVRDLRNARFMALPAADCRVDDDRRLLITRTYCARYPASPACVPGAVPGVPEPAATD